MSLQRNIRLLTWFNFFTDFKLYGPIAIIYFAAVTHSYALGASIFSITYITEAILDVPTGIMADTLGRKRIVIYGASAAVLYSIFYAVGMNFWFLALGGAFEGLARALYSGNNNALLHNMLADEGLEHDYHLYLGKLGSMFQLALTVSGLLGAIIAGWSFAAIMWISVLPQLVCLLIALQITGGSAGVRHESGTMFSQLREGVRSFLGNANLRLLGTAGVLDYGLGETAYRFQAAFFNTLLPIWAVGVANTLANAGATVGFYFSGRVINRFGNTKVLFFGKMCSKGFSLLALLFPTVLSPFVISSTSFFYGTGSVASNTLMQREFTDRQRATMSSLSSFAGSLFFGIAAFLTGLVADSLGTRNALLVLQLLSLSTVWLLWRLYRASRQTLEPPLAPFRR
ncbi:MAG: MFS transporter [Chloroflexota bacterium]|nr:MFS transporter [Chloroflexota bacterium]